MSTDQRSDLHAQPTSTEGAGNVPSGGAATTPEPAPRPGPNDAIKNLHILGIPILVFLPLFAIVLVGVYTELLPMNFVSGLAVAMGFGGLLMKIGHSIPWFGLFGGGPILCIIVPAILAYVGAVPESFVTLTDGFYNEIGFAEIVVTGLIVGSLLSMDRKMLLKTGPRFFVPLLGGLVVTMVVVGGIGALIGFGFADTLFFVVGPIMGGGMAAGAVPMSEIYASRGGEDPAHFLAILAPAVMVGNMACVLVAGILNGLGKKKPNLLPGFNGLGTLLRTGKDSAGDKGENAPKRSLDETVSRLGIGIFLASAFFVLGELMNALVPSLHAYVWIILGAALVKLLGIMPKKVEDASADWYTFISKVWVPAVLVTISAGMVDFAAVIEIVTDVRYFSLIVITVLVAATMAGLFGLLVRFHFIESSISAGLGMADMGGSGDVAVLSASERMGLMPYLQISSRIGGAIMIVILSVVAGVLM